MKKILTIFVAMMPFMAMAQQKDVHVDSVGHLARQLPENIRFKVAELKVTGPKPDLCRTQQVIQLSDKRQASYFLTEPIGNHHIIMPGHQAQLLEALFLR